MSATVVALLPSAPYFTNPGSSLNGTPTVPPVMGSLADGSDATYVRLGAAWTGAGQTSDVVSVDFHFNTALGTPTFMYMQFRAKSAFDPTGIADRCVWQTDYTKIGNGTANYDEWDVRGGPNDGGVEPQGMALAGGRVTAPTWLNVYGLSSTRVIDPDNPVSIQDGGGWQALAEGGPGVSGAAFQALTTTGVRLDMWVNADASGRPYMPYLDFYEVRMMVAYIGGVTELLPPPPARLTGRMDGRGPLGGPRRLGTVGPQGGPRAHRLGGPGSYPA